MDTSDPDIVIDKNNVCNHCNSFKNKNKNINNQFDYIAQQIKKQSKEKEYDCVIGLSGGVDSSYLAYIIKTKYNLRPLAVHLDNGWDNEIAVRNIENIVTKLNIDLITHVVNWEEFRDLQRAFFMASVIDIELVSDHAIFAILYEVAHKNKINYVLLGLNAATEKIMPKNWTFNKNDVTNIRNIHKKYGTIPLKTYPQMGLLKYLKYTFINNIKTFSPLNYIEYNKTEAKKILQQQLDWSDYGGKHYESIFTRFYQGYILPRKFGVDKRRAHFSTLINSGQMTRNEAIEELKQMPYPQQLIDDDYQYVIKKLGYTKEEFENIMNNPPISHFHYGADILSYIRKKILIPTNPIYKIFF